MIKLGIIKNLWRYPVKSMAGEDLLKADIRFTGIVGDRVWAFVSLEPASHDFPWFTARECPQLLLYRPRFSNPEALEKAYPDQDAFQVKVETPSSECFHLEDPKLLSEIQMLSEDSFKLRFSEKNSTDARPLSLISTSTIASFEKDIGSSVVVSRFRPNIYVEWDDPEPFYEDKLIGKILSIGERCELMIVKRDPRCLLITLDPETAEANPAILKHIARNHQGCAGVYAVVIREGRITPGMEIRLVADSKEG